MKGKIYQIAKKSGVSTATVSRIFNGRPYVKDEVRTKVLQVAKKLNYTPKQTARRTNIAVLIEGINTLNIGGYESMLLTTLTKYLTKNRYTFEILSIGETDILHTHFFDGIIAILYYSDSLIKLKEIHDLPIVTINCPLEGLNNIYSDHRQGVKLAFDYLVSKGHKKIGMFLREKVSWGDRQRIASYCECLKKHRIPFNENLLQVEKSSSLIEAVARICKAEPTAIIICGEDTPLEVSYALNLLNKQVPEDISIISFENSSISPYLNPPHTTICQHMDEIGRTTIERIKNLTNTQKEDLTATVIKNTLIERNSVKTINKK